MGNNHTIEIEEINIEPLTLIRDILVNWWVALLGAIGAALLTVVIINAGYEPMYTTSATFVVSMKNNASMSSYWSKAYEMAQTMQLILESNSMNKIICEELGLEKVDAENHPERKALTSYLGLPEITDADFNELPFPLRMEDKILLCSDGLYGTLSDEEMAEIIKQNSEDIAEKLVRAALLKQKPQQDNITAVLLKII